jgi:adenine-specific DNA-methyltransferase
MQHVRRDGVRWPLGRDDEHIHANQSTAWMLLRNAPMVLLRRFSPKEDKRRMTAAAYRGELSGAWLGLENHLNYVHRRGGSMHPEEALGLAAVFNSAWVDDYLRSLSGNTQINASDLRRMPMPALSEIEAIGRALGSTAAPLSVVDEAVMRIAGPAGEQGERMAA